MLTIIAKKRSAGYPNHYFRLFNKYRARLLHVVNAQIGTPQCHGQFWEGKTKQKNQSTFQEYKY